ncbi:hypothetical protein GSI_07648 [Ganoderma sinense ZZ0214-1]|uniref:Uncharacterized protein n=1 Tax=Ganoderma sinense ZZ0214-1 TaxID=1077348 RepID=A0A2G8S8I2_9APHY|nr:hypothetical protein GSI_07648 [Ganoderma sinense ZZ0214-1]
MATTFRTVSTFLTKVTDLNNTATELCSSLLDNQAIVLRIDTVARTSYLEQWEECRGDFNRILETSKGAAIKFSAAIRYYSSLHEETNNPAEVDETIKEVSAFYKKLPQLSLDQRAEFDHLHASLEKLGKEIFLTVGAKRNSISNEVNNMASRVTSLEAELKRLSDERRRRQREEVLEGARDLWNNGSNLLNTERRVPASYTVHLTRSGVTHQIESARMDSQTTPLVGGYNFEGEESEGHIDPAVIKAELRDLRGKQLQGQFELQEYEDLALDRLRDVTDEIRQNLVEQAELQEEIFAGVKKRLTDESKSYLEALQDSRGDLSAKGQLAYRNATQRVLSSLVVWERKAAVLVDEYAKKLSSGVKHNGG